MRSVKESWNLKKFERKKKPTNGEAYQNGKMLTEKLNRDQFLIKTC